MKRFINQTFEYQALYILLNLIINKAAMDLSGTLQVDFSKQNYKTKVSAIIRIKMMMLAPKG